MKRDRITESWEVDDYAVVGVPVDDSGKPARRFLRRKELAGEAVINWTGHRMLHSDGRIYEDVIIRSRTHDPTWIANQVAAFLPDSEDTSGL